MNPLIVGINAKFIHTNNAIRLLKANSRFTVDILEVTIKDAIDDILDKITEKPRLFIGFSCYIWNIELIKTLVFKLKEICNTPIILGGPEVSYDAKYFLNAWPIDLVVKGEGEAVIDGVIQHYSNNEPLEQLPGITTKAIDTPALEIMDLSKLKSPHFFQIDEPQRPKRIAYIESSRGCPYNCTYCLSSLEKHVRFFPLDYVTNSIKHLIDTGTKKIKFLDRTFNMNPDALKIIDTFIKLNPQHLEVQFEMTGDNLSNDIIDYIHTHAPKGLFRFEIGIQSTHHKTNLLVGRKQNNKKLFENIKKIIHHDVIDLHLDLIAGLPKENLTRFIETFDSVYQLGAKELQLGFLKMLRGTSIRFEAERFDYDYNQRAPYEVLSHIDLSKEDIWQIKKVSTMLDLCHNKGYFGKLTHKIIQQNYESAFSVFLRMYEVCEQNIISRNYQLEDIFTFVTNFFLNDGIAETLVDEFKPYYFKRQKVKPKGYTEKITDSLLKTKLLSKCEKKYNIPLGNLYNHTYITPYKEGYMVAYYKDFHAELYIIN